jgi:hypothetical protein
MRFQLGLPLLLLGASALYADQFTFSDSGAISKGRSVSVSGTLPASGLYEERDHTWKIAGRVPGDLSFLYSEAGSLSKPKTGEFDHKGFTTDFDAFDYDSGIEYKQAAISTANRTGFKVTSTPKAMREPSTLLIFSALGALVWALGRKLPIRRVRPSQ